MGFLAVTTGATDPAGTSITVNKPSVADGSLLIAAVSKRGTNDFVVPAGWTVAENRSTTDQRVAVWWRLAASGDPASWNWTWTGSNKARGAIYAASSVNRVIDSPLSSYGPVFTTPGGTTNMTSGSIVDVAVDADGMLVHIVGSQVVSYTPDAATTERTDQQTSAGTGCSLFIADQASVYGTTGTRTAVASTAPSASVVYLLALGGPAATTANVSVVAAAARTILDNINATTETDQDALAYAIRAEARLLAIGEGNQPNLESLTDRLWSLRYNNGNIEGFGLDAADDAFGDGSTNPADTIYSVTTAWCGLAFLDAFKVTGNSTYYERALTCGQSLTHSDLWNSTGGWPWYSDQGVDHDDPDYEVYNVSAQVGFLWYLLDMEPAKVAQCVTSAESGQGGATAWTYKYSASNTGHDLHHGAYIAKALYRLGSSQPNDWFDNHHSVYYSGGSVVPGVLPSKGPGFGIVGVSLRSSDFDEMERRAVFYARLVEADGQVTGHAETVDQIAALALGLSTYCAAAEDELDQFDVLAATPAVSRRRASSRRRRLR